LIRIGWLNVDDHFACEIKLEIEAVYRWANFLCGQAFTWQVLAKFFLLTSRLLKYMRALSIISPGLSYTDNLTVHDISTLKDRRQKLCKKLFQTVVSDADHKLYHLLPPSKTSAYNLRRLRRFDCPATRTNRFSNSYILSMSKE
jgi:hypothetical protein